MKTIGIIGGLTWLSSLEYYRIINETVNTKLGGVEAAKIILYSVNFAEIKQLTEANDWASIAKRMCEVAQKLEQAGADCLLIGANTMHKVADEIQASVAIPVLHIAEEVAKQVNKNHQTRVALLGTKYTMQLPFYKDKLSAAGIETLLPGEEDIQYINNAIYSEMGKGLFLEDTRKRFLTIINELARRGAEGVILGCTEIPILLDQQDCGITVYDTTLIHCNAAIAFALANDPLVTA